MKVKRVYSRIILVVCSSLAIIGQGQASMAGTAPTRLVILLGGYHTNSTTAAAEFGDIERHVLASVGYSAPPVVFSYTAPKPYNQNSLFRALPNEGVAALHRTISALLTRYPNAEIDLIGHSLGGAIAFKYWGLYGSRTIEGEHIQHVITLDSPVNGVTGAEWALSTKAFHWPGAVAGSATGTFLRQERDDAGVLKKNTSIVAAGRLYAVVRTIASREDALVSLADARIPGASRVLDLGTDTRACRLDAAGAGLCYGHDQVLHRPQALFAVRDALRLRPPVLRPVLLPTSTPQSMTRTVTVTVPGRRPWTDTGLNVPAGSSVSIVASGTIAIGGYTEPLMTPAGDAACTLPDQPASVIDRPHFVAPTLTCWSMIGRIGISTPFEVGTGAVFSVQSSSHLYLGVNENIGGFADNQGAWTATITVTR